MGGDGQSAQNVIQPENASLKAYNQKAGQRDQRGVQDLLSSYSTGKASLSDLLADYHKNFSTGKDQFASQKQSQARAEAIKSARDDLQTQMRDKGMSAEQIGQAMAQTGDDYFVKAIQSGQVRDKSLTDKYNRDYGQDYENGGQELSDADLQSILSTDASSQQKYNEDWVQNSDLTKGLFGKDGMQHQAENEASGLIGENDKNTGQFQSLLDEIKSGEGYKLTQDDHTAYGQLSGDVARQYGQQEQGLASALADRGLAAGPSGAAGAAFTGLQGNKMEALANMQRQVLNDRVQAANQQYQLRGNTLAQKSGLDMNRLNSARSTAGQLGAMAQNAMSNMYGRNMGSQQANMSNLATGAGLTLQGQQAYQGQLNNQFDQIQATQGPGLGDILGGIAGAGIGALTGGLGTAVGGSVGSALGQALGGKPKVSQNGDKNY